MSKKAPNYAVSFASRYADDVHAGLEAWVALSRLEMLLNDARTLTGHLEAAMPPETRWFPWFGADVVSYYSVGYVTCLEWHARSRLVDLLTYKPGAAKPEDIKQLRDSVVIEMLSADVSVAGMIGASTNVSSLDAYMSIFDRVFGTLSMPLDSYGAAKVVGAGRADPWISGNDIVELRELYEFRNMLVHEINTVVLGHPNIRQSWTPEQAIRVGETVDRLMRGLEAALTGHAPQDFPHLLDRESRPVSAYDRLIAEIPKLEARLERAVGDLAGNTWATERDEELWAKAKSASSLYLQAEAAFVSDATMFQYRYGNMREPLKVALAQSRHTYLRKMLDVLGAVWQLEPADEAGGSAVG